jgi:nucleotide-binding universal stress UspA family protein
MRILLVVDDSESSVDVIETVTARAWPENAMVRVLSVPKCVPVELHSSDDTLELAQQEMTRMAERLTSRVTDVLRAKPLSADMAIRFGDPVVQILDEAQEWSANLIVVGANSFESDDPEENVARSVVCHAPCRVEIVERGAAAYNARFS